VNGDFDGCWLERGPPSLPPRHPGGLQLPGGQAAWQARQVAHLPRGCRSTRREREEKRKKKRAFYLCFLLGFSSKGRFLMLSFSLLLLIIKQQEIRHGCPLLGGIHLTTAAAASAKRDKTLVLPVPLHWPRIQYRGAGSGGEVSIADV